MIGKIYQKFHDHPTYQKIATGLSALALAFTLSCSKPLEPINMFNYREIHDTGFNRKEILYRNNFNGIPSTFPERFEFWPFEGSYSGSGEYIGHHYNKNRFLRMFPDSRFYIEARRRGGWPPLANSTLEFDMTPLSLGDRLKLKKFVVRIYLQPVKPSAFRLPRTGFFNAPTDRDRIGFHEYYYHDGYSLEFFPNGFEIAVYKFNRRKSLGEAFFKPYLKEFITYKVRFSRYGGIIEASLFADGKEYNVRARDSTYFGGEQEIAFVNPNGIVMAIDNISVYRTSRIPLPKVIMRDVENFLIFLEEKLNSDRKTREKILRNFAKGLDEYGGFGWNHYYPGKEAARALPVDAYPLDIFMKQLEQIREKNFEYAVSSPIEEDPIAEWAKFMLGEITFEEFIERNLR